MQIALDFCGHGVEQATRRQGEGEPPLVELYRERGTAVALVGRPLQRRPAGPHRCGRGLPDAGKEENTSALSSVGIGVASLG